MGQYMYIPRSMAIQSNFHVQCCIAFKSVTLVNMQAHNVTTLHGQLGSPVSSAKAGAVSAEMTCCAWDLGASCLRELYMSYPKGRTTN